MVLVRRRRGERGAAAVEFALIMPIFLMLLFGIIDFGYMINRSSMINNAARDAARLASLHAPKADVEAEARAALSGVGAATVAVTCRKPYVPPATLGANCSNYDADLAPGGTAVVTITYQHKMLTPVGMFVPGGFDLTRKAEMRFE